MVWPPNKSLPILSTCKILEPGDLVWSGHFESLTGDEIVEKKEWSIPRWKVEGTAAVGHPCIPSRSPWDLGSLINRARIISRNQHCKTF